MKAEIKPAQPIPIRPLGRQPLYPFGDMVIGEQADLVVPAKITAQAFAAKVRSAATAHRVRHNLACSYVIRHCDEHGSPLVNRRGQPIVRVWCVKPLARGKSPR